MPLVAPPVRGLALVSFPQLGDEHVPDAPFHLCGNNLQAPHAIVAMLSP